MLRILRIFIVLFFFYLGFPLFAGSEVLFDLQGKERPYEKIISSPKTVLFLWASWCPSCRRELLRLNKNCNSYKGINFFYVNIGESLYMVKRLAENLALKECILNNLLLDRDVFLGKKFLVSGVPVYIFLRNGIPIRKSYYLNDRLLKEVFSDE